MEGNSGISRNTCSSPLQGQQKDLEKMGTLGYGPRHCVQKGLLGSTQAHGYPEAVMVASLGEVKDAGGRRTGPAPSRLWTQPDLEGGKLDTGGPETLRWTLSLILQLCGHLLQLLKSLTGAAADNMQSELKNSRSGRNQKI